MDGEAWWAAVYGVTRSRTRLSDFTFTFHFHHQKRKWQPTSVFLPGESQGLRSLVGCHLYRHTESDMTEVTQQQQQQQLIGNTFPSSFSMETLLEIVLQSDSGDSGILNILDVRKKKNIFLLFSIILILIYSIYRTVLTLELSLIYSYVLQPLLFKMQIGVKGNNELLSSNPVALLSIN